MMDEYGPFGGMRIGRENCEALQGNLPTTNHQILT
jgi:hypothetical protein